MELINSRRFYFKRTTDVSGVSGTGRVLDGVQLPSGKIVVEWRPPTHTISFFNSIHDFEAIHCHEGKGVVIWIDEDENKKEETHE